MKNFLIILSSIAVCCTGAAFAESNPKGTFELAQNEGPPVGEAFRRASREWERAQRQGVREGRHDCNPPAVRNCKKTTSWFKEACQYQYCTYYRWRGRYVWWDEVDWGSCDDVDVDGATCSSGSGQTSGQEEDDDIEVENPRQSREQVIRPQGERRRIEPLQPRPRLPRNKPAAYCFLCVKHIRSEDPQRNVILRKKFYMHDEYITAADTVNFCPKKSEPYSLEYAQRAYRVSLYVTRDVQTEEDLRAQCEAIQSTEGEKPISWDHEFDY